MITISGYFSLVKCVTGSYQIWSLKVADNIIRDHIKRLITSVVMLSGFHYNKDNTGWLWRPLSYLATLKSVKSPTLRTAALTQFPTINYHLVHDDCRVFPTGMNLSVTMPKTATRWLCRNVRWSCPRRAEERILLKTFITYFQKMTFQKNDLF
jgi:hypothetical protein